MQCRNSMSTCIGCNFLHSRFIVVAILGALFPLVGQTAGAPEPPPYAANRPLPEPTLFGEGVISTTGNETGAAFTPDGRSVYYAVGTANWSFSAIVVSHFKDGHWGTPEMASFSGQYRDQFPVISPDGSRLFFASARPVNGQPKTNTDIWVVVKTPSGWSEPQNLGAPVNTVSEETSPFVTRDGTLYFTSNRPGGKGRTDLYRSRLIDGKYTEPENLGPEINGALDEWMGCVTADGNTLIYSRRRGPQIDLCFSRKRDGVWQSASDLGAPINTPADEGSPAISPDGKYLFFTSSRRPQPPPAEPRTTRITRADMEAEFKKQEGNVLNGLGNLYQLDMTTVTSAMDERISR
jgi:hypothetical protein